MSGDGIDQLTPQDIIATLRSLPRRFGAAVHPAPGDDDDDRRGPVPSPEELANRVGSDGRSAADHIGDVVRGLPVLQNAIEQVLTTDNPVLHPDLASLSGSWDGTAPVRLDDLLAALGDAANALADRLAHVPTSDWNRSGQLANAGGSRTALDLARDAARLSADALHATERLLR